MIFYSNEIEFYLKIAFWATRWGRMHFERKFQTVGASPTNHCLCPKTRLVALSCGIKISAVHCLILSQSTRVTDRWIDRQTDGRTELRLPRPR